MQARANEAIRYLLVRSAVPFFGRDLLRVDDWDFNWQLAYRFATPMILPKGTILDVVAYYDNTVGNPRNPNCRPSSCAGNWRWQRVVGARRQHTSGRRAASLGGTQCRGLSRTNLLDILLGKLLRAGFRQHCRSRRFHHIGCGRYNRAGLI